MLVKILFSAFLLGMMLSASSYGYDVPIYTDPRCAGLGVEGHKVAECSFYLEKRTKAKLRKTYLKALAYTAEKSICANRSGCGSSSRNMNAAKTTAIRRPMYRFISLSATSARWSSAIRKSA